MIGRVIIFNVGLIAGVLLGAWFIYSTVVVYIARHSGAALEHELSAFIDWNKLRR